MAHTGRRGRLESIVVYAVKDTDICAGDECFALGFDCTAIVHANL